MDDAYRFSRSNMVRKYYENSLLFAHDLCPESTMRRNEFLRVQCGDFVVVGLSKGKTNDWWVAQVLSRTGSSLDPRINTLFQVIDVDTGSVKIINADLVIDIVKKNTYK